MSPSMIKLGLLSLVSCALAVPVFPGTDALSPAAAGRYDHRGSDSHGGRGGGAPVLASATVYSTTTEQVFVTVAPVASGGFAAPSNAAAAASGGFASISYRAVNRRPWYAKSSSTTAAAAASSSAVASVAPAAAAATTPAAASAAAAPAATSAVASVRAVGSTGKRGLAYNDATLTLPFVGKPLVSWAYNWGQNAAGLSSGFEYVPMLWGTASQFTNNWVANAKSAISAGSSHLLAFNEPDLGSQSNLSPDAAASAYRTYMHNNFAGSGVRLGSPAVTNGGGSMGLTWLGNFMTACSGCQVDFVNIHWYDSATNIDYFKKHVQDAYAKTGKPLWITEFGCTSGTDAQINTFLQTVMPWLDGLDYVERYSYFMVSSGLLVSGNSLSSYGSTFASFS